MSDTCPTVKIKTKTGFALLNESDFDPKKHELYETPKAPPAPVKAPAPTVAPPAPPSVVTHTMSDDDLRDAIERETGKAPHGNAKRETLIEQFEALPSGAKE